MYCAACVHASGVSQRAFVSGALMSISFVLMLCYYDPSFPTAASGCDWATSLIRLALCITAPSMALLSLGDCTVNVGAFLGAREDEAIRKANADNTSHQPPEEPAPPTEPKPASTHVPAAIDHVLALASYYLPTALPTWIAALGAFMVVVGGDDLRTYMMEHWPHYREVETHCTHTYTHANTHTHTQPQSAQSTQPVSDRHRCSCLFATPEHVTDTQHAAQRWCWDVQIH